MNSSKIREAFWIFFREKKHEIVPSAPMVVKNDPTLMFTNAGMNQFKDIFLGNKDPKNTRVADSQKCLRVSGKHNDLEEVGHDTYHHTMFEMLGNWSFGDYFKKEAIDWAYELLVERFKINANRLYATIFEGDENDGVAMDKEALEYWQQHLPESRILNGNKKDNFWEMGDTGPCGPCSEIHVDLRSDEERTKVDGASLVNKDHPLVIEIWNLVFIQYNRMSDGSLHALPNKHVDTGMGFERLCMVLQDKKSNYDTDVFQPLIQELAKLAGKKYGEDEKADIAMRVMADHLRAIAFSIADGQLPSNNKAGYVIRRILRRAVRYGYTFLGFNEPVIYKLLPVLVQQMGAAYPELKSQEGLIEKVIKEEEQAFLKTLATGMKLLDQIITKTKQNKQDIVDGKTTFELYDTFGFPLDLTELILKENQLKLNKKEFDQEMEAQKNRSRSASSMQTDDWVKVYEDDKEEFVGYDYLQTEVRITRYRKVKTKKQELYQLVFNLTPFYAESGGQVGDQGYILSDDEKISIIDTKKENDQIIHLAKELPRDPKATFRAVVNNPKRQAAACNHSATHLLHHALRNVLGDHVEQKGSLVHPDYLRFDFAHFQKVSQEEIRQIEKMVNEMIRANTPVEENRNVPITKAQEMGAIALFGEKYGDSVRVIKFGDSTELCGGTHVQATGEIGMFKIISESAISAGIRRIEAITAVKAEEFVNNKLRQLEEIGQLTNTSKNVIQAVENLQDENKKLKKEIDQLMQAKVKDQKDALKNEAEEINGIQFIGKVLDIENPAAIKDLAFQLKDEMDSLFLVIGAKVKGKANLNIMIADKLVKEMNLNASSIIREAAKLIQGGGGGQNFYATAGGKNPEGLHDAILKAKEILKEQI